MVTDEERRQLAELFREDDRLRAEHVDWTARRNPGASPSMRKSGDEAVLYRTIEQTAPQPATEPQPDWSQWEAWMAGHLNILRNEFRGLLDNERELIAKAIGEVTMTLFKRERAAFDKKVVALERENTELNGMVNAMLRMYGSGDVVEAKNFLKKRVQNG